MSSVLSSAAKDDAFPAQRDLGYLAILCISCGFRKGQVDTCLLENVKISIKFLNLRLHIVLEPIVDFHVLCIEDYLDWHLQLLSLELPSPGCGAGRSGNCQSIDCGCTRGKQGFGASRHRRSGCKQIVDDQD